MSNSPVEAAYLGEPGQRIFVLLRRPAGSCRGCVLVVPPFAEEMNKSRRMLTDVATELVARGVAVVLPDLFGTGDSEGDFSEASWPRWIEDLARTCRWCAELGFPVTRLLAVRLGCALAAQAAVEGAIPAVSQSVLWQPVFDGQRFLQQFLRLRTAAALLESDTKETVSGLRQRLAAGEVLEVAGYPLGTALAASVEQAKVAELPRQLGVVHWMEVVRSAEAQLPLPSAQMIDRAKQAGAAVRPSLHLGEPFWTSTEIVRIAAMTSASVEALSEEGA